MAEYHGSVFPKQLAQCGGVLFGLCVSQQHFEGGTHQLRVL
tara:strand:+ start:352 stop:474 length:123 start_codon:yes stop_codon:yes gene_type:complete